MPAAGNVHALCGSSACTALPAMKTPARSITITAEHGTSIAAARKRPATQHVTDTTTDATAIVLKRWKKVSATIWGSVSIDMSSIMPTRRMVSTMQTATITVIV